MIDFRSAPPPLSARERVAVMVVSVVVFATRIWGLARSPWDWDEMLFSLAMRDYNVGLHHPHPPGFPLFIGAAKLLRLTGLDDFRALQGLNVIAGALLVPAMFLFCRELRFRFSTCLSAALLFAFFPNVWFFGETAFSDVPAVVLIILACALLLHGCRSPGALFIGAILLGVSAGFRPQNLVIGFVPFAIAAWHQLRARQALHLMASVSACAAIVAASYWAAAASAGSWGRYVETLREHQEYIARVDSFRSEIRPPLSRVIDDFFVRPYRAPIINYTILFFVVLSTITAIARLRWNVLIALAAFVPFAIAAWLILDFLSASRFSIGYAPLIAILAADGIAVISRRTWIELTLSAILTVTMSVWTAPAIGIARNQLSPPMQAINWIRANVAPGSPVYVHRRMRPFAEYFLADYRLAGEDTAAHYLKEGTSPAPGARLFSWPKETLWNLARRRYFEVSVVPVAGFQFGDGWYGKESADGKGWRWMGRRAETDLPRVENARLRLRLFVPTKATVRIEFNGRLLDAITADATTIEREYPAASGGRLVIETDAITRAGGLGSDPRDLGARLDQLEWVFLDPP